MSFEDRIRNIPPQNIVKYLKLQGWERNVKFPNEKLIVFDGPIDISGERIQAVIPSEQSFRDYFIRIKELILSLSEIEEREVDEVLSDILNPNVDRLKIRVLSDIAKSGSLPFSYAAKLVKGLRDFLVAAACVEENPQPFYRRATKVGMDYANDCRFGQTQFGSFIVTIESMVPSPTQLTLPLDSEIPANEHFNRRVVKRIQRGIGQLQSSLSAGDISPIVNEYKVGLNANMCEALLELKGENVGIDLEYSVDWSINLPKPNNIPNVVKVTSEGFDYLESAAKYLRDEDESVEKEIVGNVTKLSFSDIDNDENDYGDRVITIRTDTPDKVINVIVPLNLNDYKLACDAHKDMKKVSVIGMLERVGNKWRLMSPDGFKVLD
ncbi:hypothetical protein M3E13_04220 [Oceanobacillus kimchii]|uniref:hypothetical protein n=1 Tax=Oceanobacillus kimchii TaxID=746691 RepID=UPI0021A7B1A8|nr:hypothetical protein [Oceanobacillus kimchii]MCT1577047.1 hypothetical protein [Oceanobacillus kimchii]MCT2135117.1 hypothetical protein [Oceanobacillus kimchii]